MATWLPLAWTIHNYVVITSMVHSLLYLSSRSAYIKNPPTAPVTCLPQDPSLRSTYPEAYQPTHHSPTPKTRLLSRHPIPKTCLPPRPAYPQDLPSPKIRLPSKPAYTSLAYFLPPRSVYLQDHLNPRPTYPQDQPTPKNRLHPTPSCLPPRPAYQQDLPTNKTCLPP